jgi:hypothetical protein
MEAGDLAVELSGQAADGSGRERHPGESLRERGRLSSREAAQEGRPQKFVNRARPSGRTLEERGPIGDFSGSRQPQLDGADLGREPAPEVAVAIAGPIERALVWPGCEKGCQGRTASGRARSRSPRPLAQAAGPPTAMTRLGPPSSASLAFGGREQLGFASGVLLVVLVTHRLYARLPPGKVHRKRYGAELLGHSDVKTTMIYTHVLNRGPAGVRSPVDGLWARMLCRSA